MAIVPFRLPPGAKPRAVLHHLLEHGDIVGKDTWGRTIIQLAVDDWVLEKLLTTEAEAADLEDGGDDEPDADDEEDVLPVVVDVVPPKVIARRRLGHADPRPTEGSLVCPSCPVRMTLYRAAEEVGAFVDLRPISNVCRKTERHRTARSANGSPSTGRATL